MLPGIPIVTRPSQDDLDRAFVSAGGACLRKEGEDRGELGAGDLAALRAASRIDEGALRAHPVDPEESVEVSLQAEGLDTGLVVIRPDLSVRLGSWGQAAAAADPRALGEWLAARGFDAPLAALVRRASPEGRAAREAFLSAAPAAIRDRLAALEADPAASDPARYRAAWDALAAAAGAPAQAVFEVCAWLGTRRGSWAEGPEVEAIAAGLLRAFGVPEVIAALAAGVPEPARAGAARFLADSIRTRGWDVRGQIPEPVRASLVEAAAATGAAANERRARWLLIDEGPLAPPGTALVGAALAGRLRRAREAPGGVVAIDGYQIVRLRPGGGRDELARILRPDTPIAVRGGDVWFVHTSGPRSVSMEGGAARDRHGAWFGLPARRMRRDVPRYHRAREEALARVLPPGASRLALRVDRDEREAYEAFGGDLPSALVSPYFWACDVADPRLLRVSKDGESQATPLAGRPSALGAQGDRVFVVIAGDEASVSVMVVGRALQPRVTARCAARPADVRGVLLVGGEVWLRLAAPLGDVLVAVEGPARDV